MKNHAATAVATLGLAAVAPCHAQNLIVNPGFEDGNTGFGTDYVFRSSNNSEGQYTIGSAPAGWNGAFVTPGAPSSPGSVDMMIVNGSTAPGLTVWRQTVSLEPGRTYSASVRGFTAVAGGPAVLQFQLDGAALSASTALPQAPGVWVDIVARWTAQASTGVLSIENLNTAFFPNDFYIDDISLIAECPADFNGDTAPGDIFDLFDFLAALDAGLDFNGDTSPADIFDLFDFLAVLDAGCP